ncbi:DUF4388 domain-containing protein [bacterium]|nr:DUF4388 domain-containing protein [bacterium]
MSSGQKDQFMKKALSWQIAAVIGQEDARALQWALKNALSSSENVEVTCVTLSDLKSSKDEYDAFLVVLDLGQPTPVEHLKALEGRVGLCAMVQPTPAQLLAIAGLPNWRGIQWEQGDHSQLANDLIDTITLMKEQIQKSILLESVDNWVSKKIKIPARLSIANPPDTLQGPDSIAMVIGKGSVSVGAAESNSSLRLPIKGKQQFFEVYSLQSRWMWRKITHGGNVSVSGPEHERPLEAGDVFEVEGFTLSVKASRSVEELLGILHQAGLRSDDGVKSIEAELNSVDALLKEFMLSAMSGELRIAGPTRKASIFLEGGRIQQVLCGSVYGLKALLRIFSWQDFRWTFNLHSQVELNLPSMDLSYLELKNLFSQWSGRWKRVGDLMPSNNVRLKVRADSFLTRKTWSKQEYIVVASVCEFENISEILNNCPLWDVEILETLVGLRQEKLLSVS